MKKISLIITLLISQSTFSGPNCVDYSGVRWLRKGAFERIDCSCQCSKNYQTPADDKKGHKCIRCEHKQVGFDLVNKQEIQNAILEKMMDQIAQS